MCFPSLNNNRIHGSGLDRAFTVRSIKGGIWQEQHIQFVNPGIQSLEVHPFLDRQGKKKRIRRGKLTYLWEDPLKNKKKLWIKHSIA